MKHDDGSAHPYIPNSAPRIKKEMLEAVAAASADDLYASIPSHLRLQRELDLPQPLTSEYELVRHVEGLLAKNTSTREHLSFLGAGCWPHHVPAVCDEINSRGEFLTAYAGEPYEDHGRFQALFEYESMMAELVAMDVVNVPTYDGFQAAATSLRMACRITGRDQVVLAGAVSPDKLSKIRDYLAPHIRISSVSFEPATGQVSAARLDERSLAEAAAVYFEVPSYFGTIQANPAELAERAHRHGALIVVSVDPISLGVLRPPVEYGADIVCGDIQPLGIHMQFGGGHGGFIATRDEEKFVAEYPSRLFGVAPTVVEGEYGFGDVAYERTSFAKREQGKEWVGTAAALWGITAGVYLALMGPKGMVEIGEAIMARALYARRKLSSIPGVRTLFDGSPHFKELVVDFNRTGRSVAEINRDLLVRGIFGGKDLSGEFRELGQSALFCFTEVHRRSDIDTLVSALKEVVR